jgi:hypothetical protein
MKVSTIVMRPVQALFSNIGTRLRSPHTSLETLSQFYAAKNTAANWEIMLNLFQRFSRGQVSLEYLTKRAVSGSAELRALVTDFLAGDLSRCRKAVDALRPFLADNKRHLRNDAQEGQDQKLYYFYPCRAAAQKVLLDFQTKHPELINRIEDLLEGAPPSGAPLRIGRPES